MAEVVVDAFEIVQVQHEHGDALAAPPGLANGDAQPVRKERAVRQAGEGVVRRLMIDGFLGTFRFDGKRRLFGQKRQDFQLPVSEPYLRRVALEHDRSDHTVPEAERNAEPAFRGAPDDLDITGRDVPFKLLGT